MREREGNLRALLWAEQIFGDKCKGRKVKGVLFYFPFGGNSPTHFHAHGKCSATELHLSPVKMFKKMALWR